ncbi:MAG: response regulator [Armatimonadetes bacterium]|nr:response regulator [Armatimonadota bacterium]
MNELERLRRGEAAPILVVDDEEVIRRTLEAVLELDGYNVETVDRAAVALTRLRHGEYLLVITDIRMPGMSGLELHRELREIRPETPVILITAYPLEEKPEAAGFLVKPFDIEAVMETVHCAARTREVP